IPIAFQGATRFGFMRYRPTEIDFDVNDLVLAHGDDLGIAEHSTVGFMTFIGHKDTITVDNEIDKLETLHHLTVRPATCKVGRPINPVIKRAGEMEVRRDQ